MPAFQNPRNEVVPVCEQVDCDRDRLSDRAFDREPSAIDLRLHPLDDDTSSLGTIRISTVGNIAIIAGRVQPGPRSRLRTADLARA